jgi:hypothetical protein
MLEQIRSGNRQIFLVENCQNGFLSSASPIGPFLIEIGENERLSDEPHRWDF